MNIIRLYCSSFRRIARKDKWSFPGRKRLRLWWSGIRRFSKINPSFFFDKAGCTRQFESELSLRSLAPLFPIKEGSTFLTKPLFPQGTRDVTAPFNSLYDPFGSPCRGQKPSGTRGCNRPTVLFFRKSPRPSLPLKRAPPLNSVFSPQGRRGKPPYSVLGTASL